MSNHNRELKESASKPASIFEDSPTFGVLVADAGRARLFVLYVKGDAHAPTPEPLVEISRVNRAEAREKEAKSGKVGRAPRQKGIGRSLWGRGAGGDDPRVVTVPRFAERVAEKARRMWMARGVTRGVLAAQPALLALLRPALLPPWDGGAWSLAVLDHDLSPLPASEIHDALARVELIPARRRAS